MYCRYDPESLFNDDTTYPLISPEIIVFSELSSTFRAWIVQWRYGNETHRKALIFAFSEGITSLLS